MSDRILDLRSAYEDGAVRWAATARRGDRITLDEIRSAAKEAFPQPSTYRLQSCEGCDNPPVCKLLLAGARPCDEPSAGEQTMRNWDPQIAQANPTRETESVKVVQPALDGIGTRLNSANSRLFELAERLREYVDGLAGGEPPAGGPTSVPITGTGGRLADLASAANGAHINADRIEAQLDRLRCI